VSLLTRAEKVRKGKCHTECHSAERRKAAGCTDEVMADCQIVEKEIRIEKSRKGERS